jgi:hypothetical protein
MRRFGVGFASIFGSFVVSGAHVACGGPAATLRAVPSAPAQTAPAATVPAPSTPSPPAGATASAAGSAEGCTCAAPKTQAYFVASGDEKLVLDPTDAQASLEVSYARASGKRVVVLTGIIRGYRTDVAADRPTTFGVRVAWPEGAAPTASQLGKELEAHVSTWGAAGAVAPRVYAVVAKSALTASATDSLLEVRGSLTLRDPASGRTLTLDKLSLRKIGASLLPERGAVFRP